jgi:epoxyqueuosine reductase
MCTLEDALKQQARRLGFDLVGIAAATDAETYETFRHWLDQGHAGDMAYLERHADAHRHPAAVLEGVRTVIMLAMNYRPPHDEHQEPPPASGRVARYARGVDYHDLLWQRLDALLAWVRRQQPDSRGRGVVDTAPLLERDFARRAGLGWFGKNTMLLNKHLGSYFFLAALLLDVVLTPDPPHTAQHCGTCTACLDACPTNAFVAPSQLDARRCISYLTIELRGPIVEDLRPLVGDWAFGCDVCQEVCPWNRKAPPGKEPALQEHYPDGNVDLVELLQLSAEEFRRQFRASPIWRPRRSGMLRNAALVLGNRGDPSAVPALERAAHDEDPVVRDAAQWALARIRQRHGADI